MNALAGDAGGAPAPEEVILPPERLVVFLVGAVQFINVLDFVMVMPLGPDFARSLGIPASQIGWIGGSYTASAAVAGLLGSLVLDRYDRRNALAVAMAGLVLGTFAGGLALGFHTLMLARVVAGFFGGPATSLSFSIIADVVPTERRGRAMGAVMGAFSVASVLGVPAGLQLAQQQAWGGWRLPFFSVSALGVIVAATTYWLLPPIRVHLQRRGSAPQPSYGSLLRRPLVLLSYTMTAVVMMAGFIVIPNISAYTQINLGYPRERLGYLYLAGGIVSFFAMRYAGRLVDRYGSARVGFFGASFFILVLELGFRRERALVPVPMLFGGFMLASAFRNVPYNTLASRVPSSLERARFMSLQSTVQHLASSCGAFTSAHLLSVAASGALVGIGRVATLSMALTALAPPMFFLVEAAVRRRDAASAVAVAIAAAAR